MFVYFYLFILNILCEYSISKNLLDAMESSILQLLGTALHYPSKPHSVYRDATFV